MGTLYNYKQSGAVIFEEKCENSTSNTASDQLVSSSSSSSGMCPVRRQELHR